MQCDSLCNRCRVLESIIDEFEKPVPLVDSKPDGVDRSHQEIIPSSSFDPACRLCLQLSSLLRACAYGAKAADINIESHEIVLKCRYWWHPDLARLVAYHRISYHGKLSYVFLRLNGTLPLSIVNKNQADYRRLRHWFRDCKTQHDYCNLHDRTTPEPQIAIKAIDCTRRTIRRLPPHTDYVCLSYVWGSSEHVSSHVRAGAGEMLRDLPKTIEDAIYVALQLGINYLWVDRYCIDQHDQEEKHHMINHMDQIYLNATFTIIAAEGNGPHAGLPGVCGTPRRPQRIVRTKELTLIGIESLSRYVLNSKWNTRGWTYQEMLLSRRILLFTDTRIYYQCLSGFGLEGVTRTILRRRRKLDSSLSWTEKVPGTKPVFPILPGDLLSNTILDRLSDYFQRSLSFPADTVRAVLGIFNVLRVTESFYLNQFHGMPVVLHRKISKTVTEDFVERLTWIVGTDRSGEAAGPNLGDNYGLPNTDLSTFMPGAELSERSRLFPSWSWAAFKADCPEHERMKGLKLIFPTSHKQVDSKRAFDASDTEIRIFRRNKTPARLSNFVRLHLDPESYCNYIDVTAWTWSDLFSVAMLKDRVAAYNISIHLDSTRASAENRLTAIHTMTYKTKNLHEEEMPPVRANRMEEGSKFRRVPSNPHERSYHSRMLLVKRSGFQIYERVGILTVDTMWREGNAPGSVEDVLKGMIKFDVGVSEGTWRRRTLRLV